MKRHKEARPGRDERRGGHRAGFGKRRPHRRHETDEGGRESHQEPPAGQVAERPADSGANRSDHEPRGPKRYADAHVVGKGEELSSRAPRLAAAMHFLHGQCPRFIAHDEKGEEAPWR